MRVLVMSKYGNYLINNSDFVPRIGDRVDCFYEPRPTVTSVLAYPDYNTIKKLNLKEENLEDFEVIVFVE